MTPPRWSQVLLVLLLSTALAFKARSADGTVSAAVSSSGGIEELSSSKKKRKKKGKGQPAQKEPASSLMIVVDDLEDRIQPGGDSPPRSRDASCSVTTGTLDRSAKVTSRGTCTLRAALEMADGVSGGGNVVLRLRAGRYRLAARLPEVQGKVHILGAEGKRGQPKKAPPLPSDPAARRKKQLEIDTADVFDPHFRPPRPGDEIGQRTAIGTTLDGDEQFQILFGGRGSQLRIENVRLEDGRATDEGAEDVRASLGGAINALGKLTMVNTAVRGNRAINGGAMYTEGKTKIERSMAEHNVADRCGGMIYSAGATAVASSQIQANRCGHYDCKKKTAAQIVGPVDEDGYIEPPPPPPGAVGEDGLGAIAEGPPLTNVQYVDKYVSSEAAAAAAAAESGSKSGKRKKGEGKRKRRKPSSAAVAELDELADELEYEEELEERMAAEEAEEEAARQRREEHEERMRAMREGRGGAEMPTEEPATCDAERHGGKGGNAHELSCEAGLWKTGRKMPTECVMWRATANCSSDGERTPDADRGCFEFVPHDASGWCECAGGHTTEPTECEHEAFTCQRECRLLRQRRKRRKQVEKGGAILLPSPPAFAIGAYGTASHLLDGFGLICSDGSRTAVAGTPPATGHQAKNFTPGRATRGAWEFVCPGWEVCRDAEPYCADWAAKGECNANPGYMRVVCARSCSSCPEMAEGSHALVGMDVRGGRMVDAVRLRCGAVDYDDLSERDDDGALGVSGGGDDGVDDGEQGGASLVSEWFGGSGGGECAVLCSSENISDGWRTGGLIQGIVAGAGERIDRLELSRCTLDLDV